MKRMTCLWHNIDVEYILYAKKVSIINCLNTRYNCYPWGKITSNYNYMYICILLSYKWWHVLRPLRIYTSTLSVQMYELRKLLFKLKYYLCRVRSGTTMLKSKLWFSIKNHVCHVLLIDGNVKWYLYDNKLIWDMYMCGKSAQKL